MKNMFKLDLPLPEPEDGDAVNLSPISSSTPRFEYRDAPIQLIEYFSDSGSKCQTEFQVNPEALEFLRSISAPLGVISVAGMYRTGKSYLLNRIILDRTSGFGVGPSVNPCTKGIWVWGRPLSAVSPEGDPCSVIVVDSEGVGALDGDEDHDARIFALAMLISSNFIYNSTGSIDESALQSVSFIANLTKHIHVKSSEEDPQAADFSPYFPKFLWVVRDFTLQLIRQEGGSCSAKDYLELALENQKGPSEQTEDRNRVRTALKTFFRDRDCFTLVRPVMNESELQRLDGKELSELRPEFVQQVWALRRKVMGGVAIKKLNGRAMSGEMLAGLLITYTKAINDGVVPSIESAWTYISAGACEKAFHEALEVYTANLARSVENNFPLLEEELKIIHREAKASALEFFDSKAFGDEKDSYLRSLKTKIAHTIAKLRSQNEELGLKQAAEFLEESYQSIENRVKSGEFPGVMDYEKELRAFQQYFLQHGPAGPLRNETLYKFCLDEYCTAADLFVKRTANELLVSGQISEEKIKRLETELRECKEQTTKDVEGLQRKLYAAEADRAEMIAREQTLQRQLQDLRFEREKTERELRDSAKAARAELNRQIEELKAQKSAMEDSMKDLERTLQMGSSEIEQERALNKQKIEFLEQAQDDAKKREKEAITELASLRKEHSVILKEQQAKLEQQLKQLTQKFEAASERAAELENAMVIKDTELQKNQLRFDQDTKALKDQLNECQRQAAEATQQLKQMQSESLARFKEFHEDTEGVQTRMRGKVDDLEKKAKQASEELQAVRLSSVKEVAVLTQKAQFLQEQADELRAQIVAERNRHESLFRAMQASDHRDQPETEGRLQELREKHKEEIRVLEAGFEEMRDRLNAQLEELREKNNDLELKLRLEVNEREVKDKATSEKIIALTEEKAKLAEELKSLQASRTALAEEETQRFQSIIKALERSNEEQRLRASTEIKEINDKSAATLTDMRNMLAEKETFLERRLAEEKKHAERRYNGMVDEFEQKIREDADIAQERIEELEAQVAEMENSYQERTAELEQKRALDQQKIETLERHLKDTKESLAGIHTAQAAAIQVQLDSFAKERAALMEKIEFLQSEMSRKDREQNAFAYKAEYLEQSSASKDKELEDLRVEFNRERELLNQKLEEAKAKNRQLADDVMQKKGSYKQELALANQHIEFQSKKIADLERQYQESKRLHSDNLRSLRDESELEASEKVGQLVNERDGLKREVELRIREVKEVEGNCAKQLAAVEREKSVLAEKLASFEGRRVEGESKLRQELAQLQAQLKEKREIEGPDKLTLKNENDRLKGVITELERDLAEKRSLLERDRLLYENKFNFLTQQKDTAKAELNEAQRKFELTLEEIRRRSLADKDKAESTTTSLLNSAENRFQMQTKELKESLAAKQKEIDDLRFAYEGKLKTLRETLELERKTRYTDSGSLERRVVELTESEQRLTAEVETLKKDRDRRLAELVAAFDSEKEQMRVRLAEHERRAKEAEHQRGQMYLEHEKERAKWALERDHIVSQRNEAQDSAERLEKRKEALLREIERLRADRSAKARVMNMVSRREAKPPISVLASSIMEEEDTSGFVPVDTTTPNTSSSDVSPLHSRKRSFNGPRAMSPLNRRETPSRIDSGRTRYGGDSKQ